MLFSQTATSCTQRRPVFPNSRFILYENIALFLHTSFFFTFAIVLLDWTLFSRSWSCNFSPDPEKKKSYFFLIFYKINFFSKCDQIHCFLQIWSQLIKKSLMENFNYSSIPLLSKTSQHQCWWLHYFNATRIHINFSWNNSYKTTSVDNFWQ